MTSRPPQRFEVADAHLQQAPAVAVRGEVDILRARALLAREDRALAIVCPPGPVRRLFTEAGIADLLFLYASPKDAATALVPAD